MTIKFLTYDEVDAIQLACEFKLSEEHTLDLIRAFGDTRKVRLMLSAVQQMIASRPPRENPTNAVELVKRLRQETDAGLLDCKTALIKADWNYDVAKGMLLGSKLSTRFTKV